MTTTKTITEKCTDIAIMLGIKINENYKPNENWEQLMNAIDFIEALPSKPKNTNENKPECVVDRCEFNKNTVFISIYIFSKETGWKTNSFYTTIDIYKTKKVTWFNAVAEFAEWFNENKIPF